MTTNMVENNNIKNRFLDQLQGFDEESLYDFVDRFNQENDNEGFVDLISGLVGSHPNEFKFKEAEKSDGKDFKISLFADLLKSMVTLNKLRFIQDTDQDESILLIGKLCSSLLDKISEKHSLEDKPDNKDDVEIKVDINTTAKINDDVIKDEPIIKEPTKEKSTELNSSESNDEVFGLDHMNEIIRLRRMEVASDLQKKRDEKKIGKNKEDAILKRLTTKYCNKNDSRSIPNTLADVISSNGVEKHMNLELSDFLDWDVGSASNIVFTDKTGKKVSFDYTSSFKQMFKRFIKYLQDKNILWSKDIISWDCWIPRPRKNFVKKGRPEESISNPDEEDNRLTVKFMINISSYERYCSELGSERSNAPKKTKKGEKVSSDRSSSPMSATIMSSNDDSSVLSTVDREDQSEINNLLSEVL